MSKKDETWKPILVNNKPTHLPLMVSDKGAYGIKKPNGEIAVRIRKIKNGNVRHRLRIDGKVYTLSLSKIVATAFVKKTSPKQTAVIHLDYDYTNNKASNLKWVTPKEHKAYVNNSPNTLLARQNKAFTKSVHGRILNEKSATELKKLIWDPKRKLSYKQLAEKFSVSEMQIYRIKNGELWFHIKVENEPENERYKQNLKNIAYHEKLKSKELKEAKGKEKTKKTRELEKKKGKKKKDKKSKKKNRK